MRQFFSIVISIIAWLCISELAHAKDTCPTGFTQPLEIMSGDAFTPMQAMTSPDLPFAFQGTIFAVVTAEDGTHKTSIVSRTPTDGVQFVITEVPAAPWRGGMVDVVLTDGELMCNPVSLKMAGLVKRDDDPIAQMIDMLHRRLDLQARLGGSEYSELADRKFVPTTPYLKWLQGVTLQIDAANPGRAYEDAMRSSDPVVRESMALLDSYLVTSGVLKSMRDELEELDENIRRWDDGTPLFVPTHVKKLQNTTRPPRVLSPWIRGLPGQDHILPISTPKTIKRKGKPKKAPIFDGRGVLDFYGIEISDVETLEALLMEQLDSESALKPKVGIYRDLAGAVLGAGEGVAQAAGPSGKILAKVYHVVGQGLFAWGMLDKFQDGMYPKGITNMQILVSQTVIYTQQEPKGGNVTAIMVTPRAKGVDLGKLALDVALQYFPLGNKVDAKRAGSAGNVTKGLEEGLATAEKGLKSTNRFIRLIAKDKKTAMIKQIDEAVLKDGFIAVPVDMTKPLVFGNMIGAMPDIGKIPPFDYPAVNVMKKGYYNLNNDNPKVLSLGFTQGSSRPYSAVSRGSAILFASTMPGKFARSPLLQTSITIEVKGGPGIRIKPDRQTIMPEDFAYFTIDVEAAGLKDENLDITAELDNSAHRILEKEDLGQSVNAIGETIQTWKIKIITSENIADFPVRLTVKRISNSDKSVRGYIDPPTIGPKVDCVDLQEQVEFSVVDDAGIPFTGLKWTVVEGPGEISNTGVYTAPKKARRNAKVRIGASKTGRSLAPMFQEFSLNCGCYWSLNVGGSTMSGTQINVLEIKMPGEPLVHTITFDNDNLTGMIASQTQLRRGSLHGTMSFTHGTTVYATACTDRSGVCEDEKMAPANYVIHKTSKKYIEGSLSGPAIVARMGAQELGTTHVRLKFRASHGRMGETGMNPIFGMMRDAKRGDVDDDTVSAFNALSGMLGLNTCNAEEDDE